jgi:hypothetical protein
MQTFPGGAEVVFHAGVAMGDDNCQSYHLPVCGPQGALRRQSAGSPNKLDSGNCLTANDFHCPGCANNQFCPDDRCMKSTMRNVIGHHWEGCNTGTITVPEGLNITALDYPGWESWATGCQQGVGTNVGMASGKDPRGTYMHLTGPGCGFIFEAQPGWVCPPDAP